MAMDRLTNVSRARRLSVEHPAELAVGLRLEHLEGEVLQLPLHLPHPEPMGERRVDLHRLARDPFLLLGRQVRQGPHVVQPVGELDDHHPHVLGHGHEHLPDALGLLLLDRSRGAELAELGDPVDEGGDLPAEALLDVRQGVVGVLGNVVEEGRRQGLGIHLQGGQLAGHRHRVGDVRLTRGPQLSFVGGGRQFVGPFQQSDVDRRPMDPGLGDDIGQGGGGRRRVRGARHPVHHGGGGGAEASQVHGPPIVALPHSRPGLSRRSIPRCGRAGREAAGPRHGPAGWR